MNRFHAVLIAATAFLLSGCMPPSAPLTPEESARSHKYWTCIAYVGTFDLQYWQTRASYEQLCRLDPDKVLAMQPPPSDRPLPVVIVGQ
jgi:hypothetical protein